MNRSDNASLGFLVLSLILFRISCTEHHEESPTEEPSAYTVKDHIAENPGADVANEVWSAKEQDGTSVFTDHSDKESAEL